VTDRSLSTLNFPSPFPFAHFFSLLFLNALLEIASSIVKNYSLGCFRAAAIYLIILGFKPVCQAETPPPSNTNRSGPHPAGNFFVTFGAPLAEIEGKKVTGVVTGASVKNTLSLLLTAATLSLQMPKQPKSATWAIKISCPVATHSESWRRAARFKAILKLNETRDSTSQVRISGSIGEYKFSRSWRGQDKQNEDLDISVSGIARFNPDSSLPIVARLRANRSSSVGVAHISLDSIDILFSEPNS